MALSIKKLKIAAILAMIFSLIIILFAIVYPIIIKVSDFLVTFFIALAMIESLVFLNSLFFYLNPKKRLFITGVISLLALLIPGIIILFIYFKSENAIKNANFET